MANGFRYGDLATLPLPLWIDFYGAFVARRLRADADLVVIMHPESAQKLRESLLRAALRARRGQGPQTEADPSRLRSSLRGIPGLALDIVPPGQADAEKAHGRPETAQDGPSAAGGTEGP